MDNTLVKTEQEQRINIEHSSGGQKQHEVNVVVLPLSGQKINQFNCSFNSERSKLSH